MPRKFIALTIVVTGLFAIIASAGSDATLTLPGIL
jgi:hypothetical protein